MAAYPDFIMYTKINCRSYSQFVIHLQNHNTITEQFRKRNTGQKHIYYYARCLENGHGQRYIYISVSPKQKHTSRTEYITSVKIKKLHRFIAHSDYCAIQSHFNIISFDIFDIVKPVNEQADSYIQVFHTA